MKLLMIALATLLSLGAASQAHAAAEWKHYGADPAYKTREQAIADAPRVMRVSGMIPEGAVRLLVEKMKSAGTVSCITNDWNLDFMRTGATGLWKNVDVNFDAPKGNDKMAFCAPTEEWSVEWEGKIWTVGIPKVCNNVYARSARKPQVKVACAVVRLTVPAGKVRSVRTTTVRRQPITDFNCWGIIDGGVPFGAPRNCDWCVWTRDGIMLMTKSYGGSFENYHTSIHVMRPGEETRVVDVVLPIAAVTEGVGVCIEVDGFIYDAAFIKPEHTWNAENFVQIPADFWVNPRVVSR